MLLGMTMCGLELPGGTSGYHLREFREKGLLGCVCSVWGLRGLGVGGLPVQAFENTPDLCIPTL